MTSTTPLFTRTRRVLRLTSTFNPSREHFARYFPAPFLAPADWRCNANASRRPAGKLTRGATRQLHGSG
jgi:hypothetical protein